MTDFTTLRRSIPWMLAAMLVMGLGEPVQAAKPKAATKKVKSWAGFISDKVLTVLPNPARIKPDRRRKLLTADQKKGLPFKVGTIENEKQFQSVARHTAGYVAFRDQPKLWPGWNNKIDWKHEIVVYAVLTNSTNRLAFSSVKRDKKGRSTLRIDWIGIQPGYVGYQCAVMCRIPRSDVKTLEVRANDTSLADMTLPKGKSGS